MERWIKINERLLDWQWFNDGNTLKVWLYLLVKANWKETKWQGLTLKRGQFVISVRRLSGILEMADKTVQRALKALLDSDCIEVKPLGKMGTLVTIKKYSQYQATVVINTTQVTTDDTTENTTQVTTRVKNIEEDKELKNIAAVAAREDGDVISRYQETAKSNLMWREPIQMKLRTTTDVVDRLIDEFALTLRSDAASNPLQIPYSQSNFETRCRRYVEDHYYEQTRITTKPSTNGTDTNQRAKLDKYLEGLY